MYTPRQFVEDRIEVLDEFVRAHPFGILVSNGSDAPHATHLPMHLERTGTAAVLRCHLARANSHWQMLQSSPMVLAIFSGPHHYITPSWYPSKQAHGRVVPTWNYVAVHATGKARLFEGPELIQHVKDLTLQHEAGFDLKWRVEDAPADYINGLSKAIVGVEISIERWEGKWKLNQNRPEADREGVIHGLEAVASPASLEMAALMQRDRDQSR